MARPRKPTKVLELSGAFDKNPKRRRSRAGEPVVQGELGAAPAGLTEKQRACWDEIVSHAVPGVLTRADRVIVECAARLLLIVRSPKPTAAAFSQLKACMQQLGMTPAARSMVAIPDGKKENPFADV